MTRLYAVQQSTQVMMSRTSRRGGRFGIIRCCVFRSRSRGSSLSLSESGKSSAKSMYSPWRMRSTSFGGIGGRPGPTSNPGRAERVDVQPVGGHAANNPGEGADSENTGATTEGVGVVEPVTEPVTAAGEVNGAPSDKQTVETKLGNETHSPNGGAVVEETPGEVGS